MARQSRPFRDRNPVVVGAISLSVIAALVLLAFNAQNLPLIGGSLPEGVTLDDVEKLELFRAVAEAVTVPVVAGTGSNDTRHSVELTKAAAGTGAASAPR